MRQGELLIPVSAIPDDARCLQVSGRIVLAEGEATGHAHTIHAIHADAELYEMPDSRRAEPGSLGLPEPGFTRYLRVIASDDLQNPTQVGAILTHQEHGQIAVAPGDYRIRRQAEYTPERIRFVAD